MIECIATVWVAMSVGTYDAGGGCYATKEICRVETIKRLDARPPAWRPPWFCTQMEFVKGGENPGNKSAKALEIGRGD